MSETMPAFMGNRAEHLAFCKMRALEYVDFGDLSGALASFTSDMSKHPETRGHRGLELMALLAIGGHMSTAKDVRDFIEGCH